MRIGHVHEEDRLFQFSSVFATQADRFDEAAVASEASLNLDVAESLRRLSKTCRSESEAYSRRLRQLTERTVHENSK
ncbi:hypothetical protein AOE01nite_17950 [Acetobacter oeni]|uniref:Uncharacterized protein n=2 Tax=Acetobacter oeni TaxID=304077 RepID=A0A511XKU3_9PROT|nr:hypothetical protein AA21952_3093 [Acetobacter oeni LMG 21952]GEN63571.1 hypothetical protein AOE01nite_17950 [Acetobacter oeni]